MYDLWFGCQNNISDQSEICEARETLPTWAIMASATRSWHILIKLWSCYLQAQLHVLFINKVSKMYINSISAYTDFENICDNNEIVE